MQNRFTDRFTDRARKVMQLANQEAQRLTHEYIGTEHILLGLIREGSGVAANVLKNLDIDLRNIRLEIDRIVQWGPVRTMSGGFPQTPRAKRVLEFAVEEARDLHHCYVGTEHLLLGLLCEEEGVAAQVLMNLGLELEDVREEVLNLLGRPAGTGERAHEQGQQNPRAGPALVPRGLPNHLVGLLEGIRAQIEQVNAQWQEVVAAGDFERAAQLRDQTDKLKAEARAITRGRRARSAAEPSWLVWNDGQVTKVAQAIDQQQRWEELPILGDALEEAGCRDELILGHCRQPGRHVRGCWVLELLLPTQGAAAEQPAPGRLRRKGK